MTRRRLLLPSLTLSLTLCMSACGTTLTEPEPGTQEPQDPSPDPDPPSQPEPPPSASVPMGTPVLYLSTWADASVFNDVIGDVIEGSRQSFFQFVPETGEAALIDTNTSVSYAQSRAEIMVFDDEVYLLEVSETGARLRHFDKDALLASPADRPIPTPRTTDSVDDDCFVVDGEDLLYKVAWRRASFPGTGYADGPLVRVSDFFSGGTEITELMAGIGGDSPSPGGYVTDACQFNMDWSDGVWYDVEHRVTDDALGIFTRDPATGVPTRVGELGHIGSSGPLTNLAFDQGWVYFAELDVGRQTVRVVTRQAEGPGLWQVAVSADLAGLSAEAVHTLDVDDGHVAFIVETPEREDWVALGAAGDDSLQLLGVGAPVEQLQILYR